MEAHKKLRYQEMKMKVLGTGSSAVNSFQPMLRYWRQRKPSYLPVCLEAYCKLVQMAQRLKETAQSRSKPDTDLKPHFMHLHEWKWCQWIEVTLLIFLSSSSNTLQSGIWRAETWAFSPKKNVPCQVLKWLEYFLGACMGTSGFHVQTVMEIWLPWKSFSKFMALTRSEGLKHQ